MGSREGEEKRKNRKDKLELKKAHPKMEGVKSK